LHPGSRALRDDGDVAEVLVDGGLLAVDRYPDGTRAATVTVFQDEANDTGPGYDGPKPCS